MKSLLKKATPFLFVFSSFAVAASFITKEEVNGKIAALFAPFNNKTTVLALQFKDLNVDSVRALDFGLNALIAKKGPENDLVLRLQNASYHYGDGSNPTLKGDLSIRLDFVKTFGQNSVNEIGENLEEMVTSTTRDISKRYGSAATLDIAVENLTKDVQGNFESAIMRFNLTIDYTKLPANLKIEDVELKSIRARLAINAHGARAKVQVVLNPLYSRFQADQTGLKEFIEKLLNEDSELYQQIYKNASWINDVATRLVTQTAQ